LLKALANIVALVLMFPLAATCWLETAVAPESERAFNFWTHLLALFPGHPGEFVRRGFYRLTLEHCSATAAIAFGAFFSHRSSRVDEDVYVGPYSVIGSAHLGVGCLIGTRVSLLSGSAQHVLGEDDRWHRDAVLQRIKIGAHVWIGEGALVMADVGECTLVAAGAVVSSPVAPRVVVAGNPARFVRPVRPEAPRAAAASPEVPARESFVQTSH